MQPSPTSNNALKFAAISPIISSIDKQNLLDFQAILAQWSKKGYEGKQ